MATSTSHELTYDWTTLNLTSGGWLLQNRGPYPLEVKYAEGDEYGIVLQPGEGMTSTIHGDDPPTVARAFNICPEGRRCNPTVIVLVNL